MRNALGGNVVSWASVLEDEAADQARRTAAMPFVSGHVALMPDAHLGKGATIGSVIPTRGAIIPAAVGVDLGCGMIAVETSLTSNALPDDLQGLHDRIRAAVPAGMGHGHELQVNQPAVSRHMPPVRAAATTLTGRQLDTAYAQFGSLGGGNHFVEVNLDERDRVWVVLHSGSRGIGNQLADSHIKVAKDLMKRYFIELEDPDLAYLVEGTPEFAAYIDDMLWAQAYALGNREAMMDAVLEQLMLEVAHRIDDGQWLEVDRINTHHNYCELENHHGKNVWLTRKGAVRARAGDRCVVPGSMATGTFIGTGLGEPASYSSCAHGAGRRMGRRAAERTLDLETFRESMAGRAWNHADAAQLIDEDPRAYKDVRSVMADQADLVAVDHELTAVLNFKGVK
jgi:tRNA-splicing ligase RtcB